MTSVGVHFHNGNFGVELAKTYSNNGGIVFDKASRKIFVDATEYGVGDGIISDVKYENNTLAITKSNGVVITVPVNSSDGGDITLPQASSTQLGCIKVGDGLNIDNNGVLSTTQTFIAGSTAIELTDSNYENANSLITAALQNNSCVVCNVSAKKTFTWDLNSLRTVLQPGIRYVVEFNLLISQMYISVKPDSRSNSTTSDVKFGNGQYTKGINLIFTIGNIDNCIRVLSLNVPDWTSQKLLNPS